MTRSEMIRSNAKLLLPRMRKMTKEQRREERIVLALGPLGICLSAIFASARSAKT